MDIAPRDETVRQPRCRFLLPAMPLLLLGAVLFSFCVGYYPLTPAQVFKAALAPLGYGGGVPPEAVTIFWNIRLPRILSAVLIGASLSVAGSAYQGMFRNPLVSPDILGVSSGASLGAALAILGGASGWAVQLSEIGRASCRERV